jgi:hypothetical protein
MARARRKPKLRQYFTDTADDPLGKIMQTEVAGLASLLIDISRGQPVTVIAVVFGETTVHRIVSLGSMLTKPQAADAREAIDAMLHHNSEEDDDGRDGKPARSLK